MNIYEIEKLTEKEVEKSHLKKWNTRKCLNFHI